MKIGDMTSTILDDLVLPVLPSILLRRRFLASTVAAAVPEEEETLKSEQKSSKELSLSPMSSDGAKNTDIVSTDAPSINDCDETTIERGKQNMKVTKDSVTLVVSEETQVKQEMRDIAITSDALESEEKKEEDEDANHYDAKPVETNNDTVNASRDVSLLDGDAAAEATAASLFQSTKILTKRRPHPHIQSRIGCSSWIV